jgi:hypothetical protein
MLAIKQSGHPVTTTNIRLGSCQHSSLFARKDTTTILIMALLIVTLLLLTIIITLITGDITQNDITHNDINYIKSL